MSMDGRGGEGDGGLRIFYFCDAFSNFCNFENIYNLKMTFLIDFSNLLVLKLHV